MVTDRGRRIPMRWVQNLCPLQIQLLTRIYRESKKHHVRQRAHCILLSYQGTVVSDLATIFGKTPRTIYTWLSLWETYHFAGLYDTKGRGRKPLLNASQQEKVRQWAKEFPKNLAQIIAFVKEEFGVSLAKRTIQRILKAFHFSWRRLRKKPKGKPSEEEYASKKKSLEEFKEQEKQGVIDLYYFDESGFCLAPYLPYAWQEKGETIQIESGGSRKRLNVLGFLSCEQGLVAYTSEGTVKSDLVIACFDAFSLTREKKTVIVLDNSSFHTSAAVEAKIPHWKCHS